MSVKRIVWIGVMLAAVSGCTSGAPRVECHWKLTPINPPAEKQVEEGQ